MENDFSKIGTLGCLPKIRENSVLPGESCKALSSIPITSKMALICGTSTCHMIVSSDAVFVPGVWGPYYSAMVPQYWLNEGGQSATGKLLDHIISSHPANDWIKSEAEKRQLHIYSVLSEVLEFIAKRDDVKSISSLTGQFHVRPDYHGNRSPLADSSMCGMVSGLRLSAGSEDLAVQYLATIQALAYGTREIIDTLTRAGHKISLVYICGGLAKNQLFVQTNADVLGIPIVLPDTQESVLLGAAILGAAASQDFASIEAAMSSMSGEGAVVYPNLDDTQYHARKYQVYLSMAEHQFQYRNLMTKTNDS
jgi:FGGY-family pentulose kinase